MKKILIQLNTPQVVVHTACKDAGENTATVDLKFKRPTSSSESQRKIDALAAANFDSGITGDALKNLIREELLDIQNFTIVENIDGTETNMFFTSAVSKKFMEYVGADTSEKALEHLLDFYLDCLPWAIAFTNSLTSAYLNLSEEAQRKN